MFDRLRRSVGATLTHLSFSVEDLPAVEARLVALGGTVIESTRTCLDMSAAVLDLLPGGEKPCGTRRATELSSVAGA